MEDSYRRLRARQIATYEIAKENEEIIAVNAVLKKDPAGREAILKAFDNNNILIKHLDMHYAEDLDGWVVNAFLDVSKTPHGASELEAFLSRLACIEQLNISRHGGIAHAALFPLMNGNERVVIRSVERLQLVRNQMERILTPAGVSVIFYNMGLENGRGLHKLLGERLRSEVKSSEIFELLRNHLIATGWGILDFKDLDTNARNGLIKFYECEECDGLKKDRPECHLARGLFAGFFELEWQVEKVKVVELRCRVLGDAYCEFALGT